MKAQVKVLLDEASKITWAIRVVNQGECFGLNNMLTHTGDQPLVEFYDTRFSHTDLGQFVARYELKTLLNSSEIKTRGLCLDGGTPAWSVSGPTMLKVINWLLAI